MYEVFKLIGVIAVILWAVKDKINEPRNVKYCCDKETDDLSSGDLSQGDEPGDEHQGELSLSEGELSLSEEEEDIVSLEDLYGDYSHLNGILLSTNTSVNNTFVQRVNQARWISPVHASI